MAVPRPWLRFLVCTVLAIATAWSPIAAVAGCGCCGGSIPDLVATTASADAPVSAAASACTAGCCEAARPVALGQRSGDEPSDDAPADDPGCDHCGCPGCQRPPAMADELIPFRATAAIAERTPVAPDRAAGRVPAPPTEPPRA